MRNTVTNVIELLIGAILIGLGLLYMTSQYRVLSKLTEFITHETIEDSNVFQQYSDINLEQVTDSEVYATIMGYREYPIMVDENLVPLHGQDYEIYFSYVKNGHYKKEYRHDANRNISMIIFSHIGV